MALPRQSHAQSRTWSFSKDTVREWSAYGDTVRLVNSGTDTLKIDSIGMELIRPSGNRIDARFRAGGNYYTRRYNQGVVSVVTGSSLVVNPGQSVNLHEFNLDSVVPPPVAKRSFNSGDTLVVRLIFVGKAGRGNDTLIAMGREGYASALRFGAGTFLKRPVADNRLFDLRGRRVEKIPESLKAPWNPVVSPGN
jgi:hypothetical protein